MRAKTILTARKAAGVERLTKLADILDQLPEGDKGYLAQTASLRDRATAIYRQQIYLENTNSPFFREHAVRQLRAEINAFYTQVGGFREPLATEFRRVAENWLRLTDVQLSEAEEQRSREPIPPLFLNLFSFDYSTQIINIQLQPSTHLWRFCCPTYELLVVTIP